jgi:dihydrofolate reductase
MSGSAGLSRSRNRKPEGSTSSGYARNLEKECAGRVAGQAVLTAEVKDGGIRKLLFGDDARFKVIGFMFGDHAGQSEAKMRNVIYAINVTLDGCFDHTKGIPPDDEGMEYYTHLLREVDLLVFGRKTYQLMVPYWPDIAKSHSETKAGNEFADTFDSLHKVVFSRSLESAEGQNTRIVRTKLRDEIVKLKREQGRNILVGGVDIPSQLIELGLVDEYRFVIQPIVAGEGRRLLEGVSLQEKLQLKLVESKIFKSGCVALRYLKQ